MVDKNNRENQEYEEDIEDVEDTRFSNEENGDNNDKKKKYAIVGLILFLALGSLFWLFKGGSKEERRQPATSFADEFANMNKKNEDENLDIIAPKINNQFDINEIKQPKAPEIQQQPLEIKLPEPPKIEKQPEVAKPEEPKSPIEAALPLILETTPETPALPSPIITEGGAEKRNPEEDYRARKRNANVLLFGGEAPQGKEKTEEDKKNEFIDLITGRTTKLHTKPSGFAKISDSYVGMKDRMILAGKIIEIVLETRITTAAKEGGMIRAIVSSDVYSESGNNILIPAGSRVIGEYANNKKSDGKKTMFRVEVGLSRIIRPDGIDILLGGVPITDPLGGKGIRPDKVNTGFGRAFMNTLMIGALSLGAFYAAKAVDDSFKKNDQNTVVNNIILPGNGESAVAPTDNQTLDDSSATIKDIVDQVTETLKNQIGDGKDIEPVLVVNQGKKLNIVMDKDIVFTDENAFIFFPGQLNALLKDCCKDY